MDPLTIIALVLLFVLELDPGFHEWLREVTGADEDASEVEKGGADEG